MSPNVAVSLLCPVVGSSWDESSKRHSYAEESLSVSILVINHSFPGAHFLAGVYGIITLDFKERNQFKEITSNSFYSRCYPNLSKGGGLLVSYIHI